MGPFIPDCSADLRREIFEGFKPEPLCAKSRCGKQCSRPSRPYVGNCVWPPLGTTETRIFGSCSLAPEAPYCEASMFRRNVPVCWSPRLETPPLTTVQPSAVQSFVAGFVTVAERLLQMLHRPALGTRKYGASPRCRAFTNAMASGGVCALPLRCFHHSKGFCAVGDKAQIWLQSARFAVRHRGRPGSLCRHAHIRMIREHLSRWRCFRCLHRPEPDAHDEFHSTFIVIVGWGDLATCRDACVTSCYDAESVHDGRATYQKHCFVQLPARDLVSHRTHDLRWSPQWAVCSLTHLTR